VKCFPIGRDYSGIVPERAFLHATPHGTVAGVSLVAAASCAHSRPRCADLAPT